MVFMIRMFDSVECHRIQLNRLLNQSPIEMLTKTSFYNPNESNETIIISLMMNVLMFMSIVCYRNVSFMFNFNPVNECHIKNQKGLWFNL